MKIWEIDWTEGKEYWVSNDKSSIWKVFKEQLTTGIDNITDVYTLKTLIELDFEEIWEPKEGEKVWHITPVANDGYMQGFYHEGDTLSFKRGFIFKTKEQAQTRVKELGW